VKNDFDTWKNKLSDRAIVLFHDTSVEERGFGVHTFWSELMEQYLGFNFSFSHGLGVLFFGKNISTSLNEIQKLDSSGFSKIENLFYFLNRDILNDEQFFYVNDVYQKYLGEKTEKRYLSEIYYGNDMHFEADKHIQKINYLVKGANQLSYRIPSGCRIIRFDPCYESLIIKNSLTSKVMADDDLIVVNVEGHNGTIIEGNIYFPEDPQIFFEIPEGTTELIINLDIVSIDYRPDSVLFHKVIESNLILKELSRRDEELAHISNLYQNLTNLTKGLKWPLSLFIRNLKHRILG
jgi:hypothetical protein